MQKPWERGISINICETLKQIQKILGENIGKTRVYVMHLHLPVIHLRLFFCYQKEMRKHLVQIHHVPQEDQDLKDLKEKFHHIPF